VVPHPVRFSCDRINRRICRTGIPPSQSVLLPQVWGDVNDRRVRNDHDPDQSSLGHRDKLAAGAGGHRKVGIDEGCQPHRRLAAIRLTMCSRHRPRLRRTQPWLPVGWPQLRPCGTKVLGPTLCQHIEASITTIHNPRRRGSSPPGDQANANDHSDDYRRGHPKTGRASYPRHGHSVRHPETAAKVEGATCSG
jgi:hypothetical protein